MHRCTFILWSIHSSRCHDLAFPVFLYASRRLFFNIIVMPLTIVVDCHQVSSFRSGRPVTKRWGCDPGVVDRGTCRCTGIRVCLCIDAKLISTLFVCLPRPRASCNDCIAHRCVFMTSLMSTSSTIRWFLSGPQVPVDIVSTRVHLAFLISTVMSCSLMRPHGIDYCMTSRSNCTHGILHDIDAALVDNRMLSSTTPSGDRFRSSGLALVTVFRICSHVRFERSDHFSRVD